jgi:hypothetical protein
MWCIDKFDQNQRIIQLQGESPISLSPSTFKKMLRLLEQTMTFKGNEAKDFLKARNGGWDILQQYLEDLVTHRNVTHEFRTLSVACVAKLRMHLIKCHMHCHRCRMHLIKCHIHFDKCHDP